MNWQQAAACRNHDPDIWFDDDRTDLARTICAGCPVRQNCAREAIDVGITDGIWGGLDDRQRRAAGMYPHGTVTGYIRGCPDSCDRCRQAGHAYYQDRRAPVGATT